MASFNRVILLGNLTRDPELRGIASGMAVTDIGLAVNDRRKGPNGEWIEETTFVDVTLWGRTAETVSEYLTKGSPVLIEGRLKLDTWEKDGQKRSKLKVVGESMKMVGSKGGGGARSGGAPRPSGARRRPGSAQGAPSYDQSGPPDDGFDSSPPDMSGGGGGDDIPF